MRGSRPIALLYRLQRTAGSLPASRSSGCSHGDHDVRRTNSLHRLSHGLFHRPSRASPLRLQSMALPHVNSNPEMQSQHRHEHMAPPCTEHDAERNTADNIMELAETLMEKEDPGSNDTLQTQEYASTMTNEDMAMSCPDRSSCSADTVETGGASPNNVSEMLSGHDTALQMPETIIGIGNHSEKEDKQFVAPAECNGFGDARKKSIVSMTSTQANGNDKIKMRTELLVVNDQEPWWQYAQKAEDSSTNVMAENVELKLVSYPVKSSTESPVNSCPDSSKNYKLLVADFEGSLTENCSRKQVNAGMMKKGALTESSVVPGREDKMKGNECIDLVIEDTRLEKHGRQRGIAQEGCKLIGLADVGEIRSSTGVHITMIAESAHLSQVIKHGSQICEYNKDGLGLEPFQVDSQVLKLQKVSTCVIVDLDDHDVALNLLSLEKFKEGKANQTSADYLQSTGELKEEGQTMHKESAKASGSVIALPLELHTNDRNASAVSVNLESYIGNREGFKAEAILNNAEKTNLHELEKPCEKTGFGKKKSKCSYGRGNEFVEQTHSSETRLLEIRSEQDQMWHFKGLPRKVKKIVRRKDQRQGRLGQSCFKHVEGTLTRNPVKSEKMKWSSEGGASSSTTHLGEGLYREVQLALRHHDELYIIFDLNGVLIKRWDKNPHLPGVEKAMKKWIQLRPGCVDFLKKAFCFFHVGIWSTMTPANLLKTRALLEEHAGEKLPFFMLWSQEKCYRHKGMVRPDKTCVPADFKPLSHVWKHFYPNLGCYNTILVDDSPYKACMNNPYNCIFPEAFDGQNNDTYLNDVLWPYLEKLRMASNIQDFIANSRIGQQPITIGHELYYCLQPVMQNPCNLQISPVREVHPRTKEKTEQIYSHPV